MKNRNRQIRFWLLQVNDALFPIGGYSHSYGLETYIQKNQIKTKEDALLLMGNRLRYNLATTELLGLKLAYEAAVANDLERLDELEDILEASLIPMEIREASKKLGSRFAKTLTPLSIQWESPIFQKYLQQRQGKVVSHACAYGVFCRAIGASLEEALETYLYAQTSAMVTNCVKSVPLSQSHGQQILTALHPIMDQVLDQVQNYEEAMFCASVPGLDIRSIQHESLYSRIYMS